LKHHIGAFSPIVSTASRFTRKHSFKKRISYGMLWLYSGRQCRTEKDGGCLRIFEPTMQSCQVRLLQLNRETESTTYGTDFQTDSPPLFDIIGSLWFPPIRDQNSKQILNILNILNSAT
jgi:hypothetical protein